MAIRKIRDCDLIICGRQAIDGDTAQVGPQVAEKLGLNQVTYAEAILRVENGRITVKRRLERGVETVETNLPLVVTVNGSAPDCRPRNAKSVQKYKHARTATERQQAVADARASLYDSRPYLNLEEWSAADVGADVAQCGLSGSPTKVKKIESVIFRARESRTLAPGDGDIDGLMKELITNHTIG
jgi:electron transfer flavoprotein beta subunit